MCLVPEINDLYQIKPTDFNKTCTMLSEAFCNDPLWFALLKDTPEKLPLVFGVPIKYTLKYGKIYAPNRDILGAAIWLPSGYLNMNFWHLIRSGAIAEGMKLGPDLGKKIAQLNEVIEQDRKNHSELKNPYIYLMALGVTPTHQKNGIGSELVQKMIKKLPPGIPLYLETDTEANVRFYERLGFGVLKEVRLQDLDIIQWEMLHKGN